MKKLLVILLGFMFAMPAFAGTISAVSNEAWLEHIGQMQSLRQQILSLVTKSNPTVEDRQNLEILNLTFAEKKAEWENYLENVASGKQVEEKQVEELKEAPKAKKPWSRYNKKSRKHRKHVCESECKDMNKEECKKACGEMMKCKKMHCKKAHKMAACKEKCEKMAKEACKGMSKEECKKACGEMMKCKKMHCKKAHKMAACKEKCEKMGKEACKSMSEEECKKACSEKKFKKMHFHKKACKMNKDACGDKAKMTCKCCGTADCKCCSEGKCGENCECIKAKAHIGCKSCK